MKGVLDAARRIGAARAAALAEALADAAVDELDDIASRRVRGGVMLAATGLARRLAFAAPVSRLVAAVKARP